MVRILRVGALSAVSIVASVVVLPLPVGPVTTIIPCGSSSSRPDHAPVASAEAELAELEQAAIARQQADDRRLAVLRRHGGDADVDLGARDAAGAPRPSCGRRRSAMLSPARILMREMSACGSACAGGATGRSRPSTRMRTMRPLRLRLDMDVARAQLDRPFDEIVDGAHDRSAARQVAQAVDAFFRFDASGGGRAGGVDFVAAEALAQRGLDVVEGGDPDLDRPRKGDLDRLAGVAIAWIRHGEAETALAGHERIDRCVAQKTPGEMLVRQGRRQELRQPQTRQAVKGGGLVGQLMGGELARLPDLAKASSRQGGTCRVPRRGDNYLLVI